MPMLASGTEWSWAVTGNHRVAASTLDRALGPRAAKVWRALCKLRDYKGDAFAERGELHASRAWMAEQTDLSVRVIRKAVARLTSAGLLLPGCWRLARLPGRGEHPARAWFYAVRGGLLPKEPLREQSALVPEATAAWVAAQPGRGGRRVGAGRPAKAQAKNQRGADPSEGAPQTPQTTHQKNQKGADPQNQKGAAYVFSSSKVTSAFPSGKTRREVAPTCSSTDQTAPPPTDLRRAPPFPGDLVAAPAKVPPPPKLAPGDSDEAIAKQLAWWYCRALDAKYPLPRGKRHFVQIEKYEAQLVAAGRKLIEHGIAPVAWVNFSIRKWKHDEGRRGHPHLRYVFNAKAIEEQRGWFARDEDECVGGRVIYGPRHRDLYLAHLDVTTRLRLVDPDDALAVHAVVEEVLPGETWDRLVRFARAEAANTTRALQAKVQRGEWIW